jgi:ABC-type multidrug transport system ATPase subunit
LDGGAGRGERLCQHFAQEAAAAGIAVTPEAASYAVAVARLVLDVTVSTPEDLRRRSDAIHAALGRRSGLAAEAVAILVRLAGAPEYRARVDLGELEAFVARFGEGAGGALRAAEAADLDLAGFSSRYGAGEALRLLDELFVVLASDGSMDHVEVRRIEDAAKQLGVDTMLVAALHRKHDPVRSAGAWDVELKGERVRIGRSPASDLVLTDPQVAPRHADLVRSGSGWRVVDAQSGRPTVLDGRPVTSSPLLPASELRIGPYLLRLADETNLRVDTDRSFAALSARHLSRVIAARNGPVTLLDDVSFTVFSGEVIAMVGPSGCGKTTLLNAIAGVTPADSGGVLLDGEDFHQVLRDQRARVGIVPQDDIVHPELTVVESLEFGARLRLGAAADETTIHAEVDRVLAELGIEHIRGSRIGDALRRGISGGQRKRVNLGQELLARSTRVLFLDEPTSGLDPRASQDIVRLVRQLADRGRIVFIVTHDLTPQVIAQVDHLMVLAPGGRLAYFGPPADACRYFGVSTPDAIFNRFADKSPTEWATAYKESADARTYVAMREELLGLQGGRPAQPRAPAPVAARQTPLQQLVTLTRRYARVKSRDVGGLAVLFAQAPILAVVMRIVFRQPTKEMLFMLSLSCTWFGMSAAVRELISDRVIWLRERRVGVRPGPYVASKVLVLGAIVAAECAVFAALNMAMHPVLWDHGWSLPTLAAISAVTGICGLCLGLLVSAVNSSSEGAVGMLPLILIPQISFSGMLLSLSKMTEVARGLATLNPARYAYHAMFKAGKEVAAVPRYGNGDWEWLQASGSLYDLGFKPPGESDPGLSLARLMLALAVFSVGFLAAAYARVRSRRAE